MSVYTPQFFGVILRKCERTQKFIDRETEHFQKFFPNQNLNEDKNLIGFMVAMSGHDLDLTVEELEKDGAILGADFVTMASGKGVVGDLPEWLMLELGPEDSQNPEQQLYSLKL